ncbi:hypothetical protein ASG73_03475 [Janibacter sp. Soil728]|uniref:acyl-CoA dehydrogenase n=1 Tax=Janibacter sp. Soil728 TaxID=1736393 RepID=UPI0006F9BFC4|nr:acyl-CoA dehydrogenase [Janibacter sp. Soil728]KRE39395.1 hypothetical protein ASG73_03475 [Janibacter sp. Soil728]
MSTTTRTTDPSAPDPEIAAVIHQIISEHAASGHPQEGRLDRELWGTLAAAGLTRITGSEDRGGSGAGWPEAAALIQECARHGALVPVVENDLLAGWLLDQISAPDDDATRTVAIVDAAGAADDVAWAGGTDRVVLLWQHDGTWQLADVATHDLTVTAAAELSDAPCGHVRVDLATLAGQPVPGHLLEELCLRWTWARSLQVSAALEAALDSAVRHTTERVQFGRPLARFQAVQHLVADMAVEAGLARVAATAALVEVVRSGFTADASRFAIAAAASCVGHASSTVVRQAHQVHGAMGTTREHDLHLVTRPVLRWRNDPFPVRHWDRVLAELAVAQGPDGLWPLVTDGLAPRLPIT